MVGPIQGPDIPPDRSDQSHDTEKQRAGSRLFKDLTKFFFFCLSKDIIDTSDTASRQCFAEMFQISKQSASGGDFLPKSLEERAEGMLAELSDALQSGKVPRKAVPAKLTDIVATLTRDNKRAKFFQLAVDLEIHLFGATDTEITDVHARYKELLNTISGMFAAGVPEICVEKMNRELLGFLSDGTPPQQVVLHLKQLIEELQRSL